ncbi:MAG: RnfH family protein [Burkholderiales bacterium]
MGRAEVLSVTVVYSPRSGEIDEVLLALEEGATVADALRASGVAARHDTSQLAVGVWGVIAAQGDRLRDRDRVELYRPLLVDPKEARRLRQQKQRGRLKG